MTWKRLRELIARMTPRLRGSEFYSLEGEEIVRRLGFRHVQRIHSREIASWSIEHGMVFDIISIDLTDGTGVIWLDRNNDLIQALVAAAGDRKLPNN